MQVVSKGIGFFRTKGTRPTINLKACQSQVRENAEKTIVYKVLQPDTNDEDLEPEKNYYDSHAKIKIKL